MQDGTVEGRILVSLTVMRIVSQVLSVGVFFFKLQYLRPSRRHMRVYEYVPLDKYDFWKDEGMKMVLPSCANSQSSSCFACIDAILVSCV